MNTMTRGDFVVAFTAGQFARASIKAARSTMRYAIAAHRAGNHDRADDLAIEARGDQSVFRALVIAPARPGFFEGYHDDQHPRTAPELAVDRYLHPPAPTLPPPAGWVIVDARQGYWDALAEDLRNPCPEDRP